MNWLDYIVLLAVLLAIPAYGLWKTRAVGNLEQYLKGDASIRWATIGLSVMATQAGPITFLSMPGQAFENGISFVQNYFGQPFALIAVCAIFVPLYHRLKVVTAYEYLGQRFDQKTRLLGAFLFLVQRGLAAGITIYAPAIIISALLGWGLNLTICLAGGLVVIYTVLGGTKIVSITQQYQMLVILGGMAAAFAMAVHRLPADVSFSQALSIAGSMDKLQAVDFSFDYHKRYTFWSGVLGGFFLALSYFGADQSQVGRYLAGESPTASRFGLMFNSVVKVPMQFMVLLVGIMVFVFYQFELPPLSFNQPAVQRAIDRGFGEPLAAVDQKFRATFAEKQTALTSLIKAQEAREEPAIAAARSTVQSLEAREHALREEARVILKQADPNLKNKDSDYVFLTFVLNHLPHGLVGLLVAVIFSAAMSATAATLNALGSTSAVDFYRPLIRPNSSDEHFLLVTRVLTVVWGLMAIGFALFANFVESLIEAGNIIGSLFYGSILGLFLAAFFLRRVRGTAVFVAALVSQALVLILFFTTSIGYLWYNLIGCLSVLVLATILQLTLYQAGRQKVSPAAS